MLFLYLLYSHSGSLKAVYRSYTICWLAGLCQKICGRALAPESQGSVSLHIVTGLILLICNIQHSKKLSLTKILVVELWSFKIFSGQYPSLRSYGMPQFLTEYNDMVYMINIK